MLHCHQNHITAAEQNIKGTKKKPRLKFVERLSKRGESWLARQQVNPRFLCPMYQSDKGASTDIVHLIGGSEFVFKRKDVFIFAAAIVM